MKIIALTQNKRCLVDDNDFDYLNQFNWCFAKGYAMKRLGKNNISMHRFLLNPFKNKEIDHINGNGLDNRRINLRICTSSENKRNVHKRKNIYRGITFSKDGKRLKRYQAQIRIGKGKRIYIGRFKTQEEAARAYDEYAKKYHKEFATLNFLQ